MCFIRKFINGGVCSILLYGEPMESYTTFAVKLECSRVESDLSHLSGICREVVYNSRKDLVNCKIVPRSLVELR